ncbi:MAG: hypothetical protein Q8909_03475 [Bacteroidota bacterium]|nr:hypothetical protein [Bacteroidota bacterium]
MEKPYVIGIDMGGTGTKFGIVDAKGEILGQGCIALESAVKNCCTCKGVL